MKNKLIKYLTLSTVIISCLSFTACGEDETVEVVAPIESEETVEPVETVTEEIESVIEESTETVEEVESIVETLAEIEEDFKVKDMEPTTMYALQSVNLRQGPHAKDFKKVGSLKYAQSITVTGEVKEYKGEETNWLRAETEDGEVVYVAAKYLSIYKPSTQTNSGNNGGSGSGNNSGGNSNSGGSTGHSGVDSFFGRGGGFSGAGGGQADANAGGAAGGVTLY